MLFKLKVDIEKVEEAIHNAIHKYTKYDEKNSNIKVNDQLNCTGYVEVDDKSSKEISQNELDEIKSDVLSGQLSLSDSNDLYNQLMEAFGAHGELDLSDEFYASVQHEADLNDRQMKKLLQSMLQNVVIITDKLSEQVKGIINSLNKEVSNVSQSLIDLDAALENNAYRRIVNRAIELNTELTAYSLLEMFLVLWGPWNQEIAKIAASHRGLREKYNLSDPEAIPTIDPSEFAVDAKEEGIEELISQILEMYPSENIVKVNKQYLALV